MIPDEITAYVPLDLRHADFQVTASIFNNARRLWNASHAHARKQPLYSVSPDRNIPGFHYLGSGLYRSAYRRGDYVYKYAWGRHGAEQNASEHAFMNRLREAGDDWMAPATQLVGKTLVMRYYEVTWGRQIDGYTWMNSHKKPGTVGFDELSIHGKIMSAAYCYLINDWDYWDGHGENLGIDQATGLPVLVDGGDN